MEDVELTRIEWLKDMQRLRLGPGDVLIMRLSIATPRAEQVRIERLVSEIFPDNEFLLVSEAVEIGVIEQPQTMTGSIEGLGEEIVVTLPEGWFA